MKTLLTTTADHLAVTTGFVQRVSPLSGSRFAQILVFSWWADPAATCTARADMAATLRCPLNSQAIDQRFTPRPPGSSRPYWPKPCASPSPPTR